MKNIIALVVLAILSGGSFFLAASVKEAVGIVIEDMWRFVGVLISGIVGIIFLGLFIWKLVKLIF